jgi:hypothetical protein
VPEAPLPGYFRSITAVRNPARDAANAADKPAIPAPKISSS